MKRSRNSAIASGDLLATSSCIPCGIEAVHRRPVARLLCAQINLSRTAGCHNDRITHTQSHRMQSTLLCGVPFTPQVPCPRCACMAGAAQTTTTGSGAAAGTSCHMHICIACIASLIATSHSAVRFGWDRLEDLCQGFTLDNNEQHCIYFKQMPLSAMVAVNQSAGNRLPTDTCPRTAP